MIASAESRVSTSGVAPAGRLAFWNQVVAEAFDDIVVDARPGFEGAVAMRRIGNIEFARIESGAAQVRRLRPLSGANGALFKIHLQERGSGVSRQGRHEAVLQPGAFTLCDASQPYSLEFAGFNQMMVLRFPAEQLMARMDDPGRFIGRAMDAHLGANRILTAFLRSVWENEDAGADFEEAIAGIIMDMMAGVFKAGSNSDGVSDGDGDKSGDRSKSIRAYIDAHISDPSLRASTVAKAMGVSSRSMQMVFARSGMTATEYIVRQRLKLAATRLMDGATNITELAYDLGFSDLTYFSKSFRRRFGVSPRGYCGAAPTCDPKTGN